MQEAGALSDGEIVELVKAGTLGIEPFDEARLTPNGYDLEIREVASPPAPPVSRGVSRLPAGTRFAVSTREYVRLPDFLMGNLWLRTSWARKGVLASFGVIDAGFEGELTLGAYASAEVEVEVGKTFAQMVFFRLGRPAIKPYAKRSGNYQGQRGVTLEPRERDSSTR